MTLKKVLSLALFLMIGCQTSLFAQANNPDFFRSIGKIYAVVAVILVVLIGIFLFLFYLERKSNKMEQSLGDS